VTFAEPLALLLLLPVAAAALALHRQPAAARRLPGAWRRLVEPALRPALAGGIIGGGGQARLAAAAAALLALALARPLADLGNAPDYANLAGRVIVVDLGAGAGAGDAKLAAAALVAAAGPVPTAIVAAAGEAYTVAPLTTDRTHLERYLRVLTPEIAPVAGRALHTGLAHAEALLREAGIAVGQIVLVSGGPAPAHDVDIAPSETLRVMLAAGGNEADWQAFAAANGAEVRGPQDIAEIAAGLERAAERKLRRSAAGAFAELAPWLTGLAMLLWLGFFRRRTAR